MLEGGRFCEGDDLHQAVRGPYTLCRQITRTGEKAAWPFKMQGHNEGREASRSSIGGLDVVYERTLRPSGESPHTFPIPANAKFSPGSSCTTSPAPKNQQIV